MMMLAANVPDLDVALGLTGGLAYIEYHRGYAHSLLMAPVMAVIPLLLARWIRGASLTWRSYLACVIGVLSHLALDLTNVYGVRLLLPFSPRWLHLDITQIVDPWILLIFVIAMAAPALSGLVNSEIRGKTSAGPKRAWALAALVALLGYEGFRFTAHQRAVAMLSAYSYGGDSAPRIWAMPSGVSPLRWRGVVETSDSVLDVPVDITADFDPDVNHNGGRIAYPAPESPALNAARATAPFQEFAKFNQVPFWRVTQMDDLIRVDLIDLRFGTPWQAGFAVATALVTPDGHVRETHFGLTLPAPGR